MSDYLFWFTLVTRLAGVIAAKNGVAPKELEYFKLLTDVSRITMFTQADLKALEAKYEAERGTPVTVEELDALSADIRARNERIQATGEKP